MPGDSVLYPEQKALNFVLSGHQAVGMADVSIDAFYNHRTSAIALGRDGPVRDYILLTGATPSRVAKLADLLVKNGIEVRRVTEPVTIKAKADSTSAKGRSSRM